MQSTLIILVIITGTIIANIAILKTIEWLGEM